MEREFVKVVSAAEGAATLGLANVLAADGAAESPAADGLANVLAAAGDCALFAAGLAKVFAANPPLLLVLRFIWKVDAGVMGVLVGVRPTLTEGDGDAKLDITGGGAKLFIVEGAECDTK